MRWLSEPWVTSCHTALITWPTSLLMSAPWPFSWRSVRLWKGAQTPASSEVLSSAQRLPASVSRMVRRARSSSLSTRPSSCSWAMVG